jgi:hypothetical protein
MHKLRRTVIKGIPCRFIEFKKINQDDLGQILGETAAFTTIGPVSADEPNLRAKIWNIVCLQDSV